MAKQTPWDRLPAYAAPGILNVVVETPRGSRNKYKYDEELGLFRLNRVLFAGASFPFDFGFVPQTKAGDGDPLDVLVLMDAPAFPGCLVYARPIGVLRAKKDGKENHRLIAISTEDKTWSAHGALSDLPRRLLREIEQFFHWILDVEGTQHELLGWRGLAETERIITRGIAAQTRDVAAQRAARLAAKKKK
ncbi:MAG: inorganic diphosphatase [Deltaproteobacteria bacterium]|nr:inorganic diphosphatase [Deltaproteobacteria bacterium]